MTRVGVLVVVLLAIGGVGRGVAAPSAGSPAPMTVKVVPRSGSGVFRDTTLVYLDGRIDSGAPDRLSRALGEAKAPITIWLNSPGGNLFAGMQLGRIIRAHGASTHIIDFRTLRPGECYSACAMAFLGGVHRFSDHGARYGVHQASLRVDRASGGRRDLGGDLTAAIESYIREMGVDARLFDLWAKAAPDQMYVLSLRQARELRVVYDGREPPEWAIAPFPGGTMLQGRQVTDEGRGTVFFSCDGMQTTFGSVYEGAGAGQPVAERGWTHVLTLDGDQAIPLKPLAVSIQDGVVRTTFRLPPDLLRYAMSAERIGHRMAPSSGSPSIGVGVDVDEKSALMVRTFLGRCLRQQAK